MKAIITTRLPPATCGIGSYSALLREHWPDLTAPVAFLVMDGATEASRAGSDQVAEFHGSGAALSRELDRLGGGDLLLHYAGRAYQRFGCPMWLPGVLARWKRKFPGSRLMIMAHEVPGRLPMRSRHFWLAQVNASIIRRLCRIADVLVTNTPHHAAELSRISGRSDVQLVPVGSNISGSSQPAPQRSATEFVVFGLPFGRMQTLQKFDAHVQEWHAAGSLTTLHLIGPLDDEFTSQADAIMNSWPATLTVVRHGELPPAEVARLLQSARFALTNVTEETWSKSGTFMACAAHGCAIVLAERGGDSVPLSYTIAGDELETITDQEVERRTAALAQWYRENADWPVIAAKMAALW